MSLRKTRRSPIRQIIAEMTTEVSAMTAIMIVEGTPGRSLPDRIKTANSQKNPNDRKLKLRSPRKMIKGTSQAATTGSETGKMRRRALESGKSLAEATMCIRGTARQTH
jgi:hypothetical protein